MWGAFFLKPPQCIYVSSPSKRQRWTSSVEIHAVIRLWYETKTSCILPQIILSFLSILIFIPGVSLDPSVTRKVGTDIQDNKCCWLMVQCLLWATPQQLQILENYGQMNLEIVIQVKAQYEALDCLLQIWGRQLQHPQESHRAMLCVLSPIHLLATSKQDPQAEKVTSKL